MNDGSGGRRRSIIVRAFKSYSLSISLEAKQELEDQLRNRLLKLRRQHPELGDDAIIQNLLNSLLKNVDKEKLNNSNVGREDLVLWFDKYDKDERGDQKQCIYGLHENFDDLLNDEEVFCVSTAFDMSKMPNYVYDPVKKIFELKLEKCPLMGTALDRVNMYRQRYYVIYQRLMRNDFFKNSRLEFFAHMRGKSLSSDIGVVLDTTESLFMGFGGKKYVFGMITQMEEGKYYLEDLKSMVELDFSQLDMNADLMGWVTESSFVVCEGRVSIPGNDIFVVERIHFPAAESLASTLKSYPSTDFFGDFKCFEYRIAEKLKYYENKLNELSEFRKDVMLVLSDVWLDNDKVIEKLKKIFFSWEDNLPCMVVIMGSFVSLRNTHSIKAYVEGFAKFKDIWDKSAFSKNNVRLVVVPGPMDLSVMRDVLPKPPLPKRIKRIFAKNLVFFCTNPSRIRVFSRHVLLFREDLTMVMRRNSIINTNYTANSKSGEEPIYDVGLRLVHTILGQSHLCPVKMATRSVFCNYDHALRVYPLPDIVIVGDCGEYFSVEYEGCRVVNPSSFSREGVFCTVRLMEGCVEVFSV